MDISIDIETLSTRHNAIIVQIGLVRFDRAGGEIDHLCLTIDRYDGDNQSRHMDEDTLIWWDQHGGAPDQHTDDTVPLGDALEAVASLIGRGDCVFAKGPSFDLVILADAYRQTGRNVPWRYTDERCIRTVQEQITALGGFVPPLRGTAHNALNDARHQARIVMRLHELISDMRGAA